MHSARSVIKPCQSPIRVYLCTSLHWLLLPVRLWPSADWRVGCLAAASFTSPVWCALWCERVGSESTCMCTWCVASACQLKRLQVPLILRRRSQQDNAALPLTNLKRHVHLAVQIGPYESCFVCGEKKWRLVKGEGKRRALRRHFHTLIGDESKPNFHTGMRT